MRDLLYNSELVDHILTLLEDATTRLTLVAGLWRYLAYDGGAVIIGRVNSSH